MLDLKAIAENVRGADTEDLLDRITAYRADMEPVALDLIEGELSRRGVSMARIAAHAEWRGETAVTGDDGVILRCEACDRPAVEQRRDWHRLWGRVPLFRRTFAYCGEHAPADDAGAGEFTS